MRELSEVIKSPLDPLNYAMYALTNGIRVLAIDSKESWPTLPPDPIVTQIEAWNDSLRKGSPKVEERRQEPPPNDPPPDDKDEAIMFSVVLGVGAGLLSDPPDHPGLSHLLEHVVLMRSKKFPELDGLSRAIERMGGFCNAHTFPDFTFYGFSVTGLVEETVGNLENILDRLSDLLANPQWTKDDVLKELRVVDSEFWKAWMDDGYQYAGLLHHFGNRNHPLSNLGTYGGNLSSLSDTALVDKLRHFKNKYYTGDNLSIVIVGPAPVLNLAERVDKYFKKIPSSGLPTTPRDVFHEKFDAIPPLDMAKWHQVYEVVPSEYDSQVTISWALPLSLGAQEWKTKPLQFLSYVLSLSGKGSLEHHLKSSGWIKSICCNCIGVDCRSTSMTLVFVVKLSVMKDKMEEWEHVVMELFRYLEMLQRSEGGVKDLYDEFVQLQMSKFHFRSEQDPSKYSVEPLHPGALDHADSEVLYALAQLLLRPPDPKQGDISSLKYILLHHFVAWDWKPEVIKQTLDCLLNLDNTNVLVASKDFPLEGKTKWHTLRYSLAPKSTLWTRIRGSETIFQLPTPNAHLRPVPSITPIRKEINVSSPSATPKYRIRVEDGDACNPPGYLTSSSYTLVVKSDVGLGTLSKGNYPVMKLVAKVLDHLLYFRLDSALSSLFTVHVEMTRCAKLEVTLKGPSIGIVGVFTELISTFAKLEEELTPAFFHLAMEDILQWRTHRLTKSESYISGGFQKEVLDAYVYEFADYKMCYESLSLDSFVKFVASLKDGMMVEVVISGCTNQDQVDQIKTHLSETLGGFQPRRPHVHPCGKNFRLEIPLGTQWTFRRDAANPLDYHHWVAHHFQIGVEKEVGPKVIGILTGLAIALSNEAMYDLRRDRLFGYVAQGEKTISRSVSSLNIVVNAMASRFTVDAVDEEVEEFVKRFYHHIVCDQEKYDVFIQPHMKKGIRRSEVKDFYKKYLLPSGKKIRKAAFLIKGRPNEEEKVKGLTHHHAPKGRSVKNKSTVDVRIVKEWRRAMDKFPNATRNYDDDDDDS